MNIVGHETELAFLRKLLSGDGPSHHAFLVSGPEGIGKNLFALRFAAELLGRDEEALSGFQDFLRIAPSSGGKGAEASGDDGSGAGGNKKAEKEGIIDIGTVRNAMVFLSRFPAEAVRRVLLVEDADHMNVASQNAVLKLLEEPNGTSVIILVSSRPVVLLPTIRSRTFRISLSLVPAETIRAGAEAEFGKETCARLQPFFYELGRPGIVLDALREPGRFSGREETLRKLFRMSELSVSDRLELSEKLSGSVPETVRLLEWWSSGLRASRITESASPDRISKTYRLLEAIEETVSLLKTGSVNARIVLDRLFLTIS